MTDTYHARVEELPWVDPAPRNGLLEVFRRRYLLRLLVRREISARYSGSFLGLMWSYINPLSQFLIYFFVIGILIGLHQDVPNFAIHMFCGIILVHYFTETFNAGTRSIMRNKAIVRKMAMPNEMFPVASMLVSLYHVGPQMVILLIACFAYGWMPDPAGVLAVVLALLIIMILGTALALLFSAANVFFRDWASVVNILTNFVRFGVPMIYPYSMVEERFGAFADYYLLNPIAVAVLLFQRAFWVGTTDHPEELAQTDLPDNLFALGFVMIPACLVILVIAQLVFSRLESKIPERI
jgi:ABC-2 type transport system permease protein